MGKADMFSPKGIAKQMKQKGLQKLRFYCQMCQKQCRDENGFKCHLTSEGHQRAMSTFGAAPDKFIDDFSREFERSFLEHLSHSHRNTRVSAQNAYNEFITNRHHLHMNATQWPTLTDFIKHLGSSGVAVVEETPKGLFLTYKPQDAEELMRERMLSKRKRAEESDDARQERMLREQIERAAAGAPGAAEGGEEPAATELRRDEGERVAISLGSAKSAQPTAREPRAAALLAGADELDSARPGGPGPGLPQAGGPASTLERMMRETEQAKERKARQMDNWLFEGIVVKVVAKELKAQGYYKQKGVVMGVIDRYVGEVRMLDGGDVLRIDQAHLETVLPSLGSPVLVVKGVCRGSRATLLRLDTEKYQAHVRVAKGEYEGRELALDYEDVCKLATS